MLNAKAYLKRERAQIEVANWQLWQTNDDDGTCGVCVISAHQQFGQLFSCLCGCICLHPYVCACVCVLVSFAICNWRNFRFHAHNSHCVLRLQSTASLRLAANRFQCICHKTRAEGGGEGRRGCAVLCCTEACRDCCSHMALVHYAHKHFGIRCRLR